MGSKAAHNKSKFMRFVTFPLRVLAKARDLYVNSLTKYSDRVGYGVGDGMGVGVPAGNFSANLPKSFSVNSSRPDNGGEDFVNLIRAASVRNLGHRNQVAMFLQQQQQQQQQIRQYSSLTMGSTRGLPKSSSVGMGKIDEDTPCDNFGDDIVGVKKAEMIYPRSRSVAVAQRRLVF